MAGIHCHGRVEQQQQKSYGPQSIKYLVAGTLIKSKLNLDLGFHRINQAALLLCGVGEVLRVKQLINIPKSTSYTYPESWFFVVIASSLNQYPKYHQKVDFLRGSVRQRVLETQQNNVLHHVNVRVTMVKQCRAMILDDLKSLALDSS